MSLPLWECGLKYLLAAASLLPLLSLPLWECGLKSLKKKKRQPFDCVAPFVGVWIEIFINTNILLIDILSLPLWECGLKSVIDSNIAVAAGSLPLWECGLK